MPVSGAFASFKDPKDRDDSSASEADGRSAGSRRASSEAEGRVVAKAVQPRMRSPPPQSSPSLPSPHHGSVLSTDLILSDKYWRPRELKKIEASVSRQMEFYTNGRTAAAEYTMLKIGELSQRISECGLSTKSMLEAYIKTSFFSSVRKKALSRTEIET